MHSAGRFAALALPVALILALLACGPASTAVKPVPTLAPIVLGPDLSLIDLCAAVPRAVIEPILGRKLAHDPKPTLYYAAPGATGCEYDAVSDSAGNAYFGYVELAPAAAYAEQPLSDSAPASGLGQSAYFNNGADARQLWVKINDTTALVIAFGDQPNEPGATTLARLILAAISVPK